MAFWAAKSGEDLEKALSQKFNHVHDILEYND